MTTITMEKHILKRLDALEDFAKEIRATLAAPATASATAPEPVAWLARYVGRSGMEQEYVSTDKTLADENDASGKAQPLYLHPPSTAPAHTEAEASKT